jgi:hypothetical protein
MSLDNLISDMLGGNAPEPDSFSFSGMSSGWFSQYFHDDFGHFRYIGARDKLLKLQKEKSAFRRMMESMAQRTKLTSLISIISEHVLGMKIPKGSEPNKLAEDIIKILDEERNKRSIEKFLEQTQRACRKDTRYFDTVGAYSLKGIRLSQVAQSSLQDQIVVVMGQLVHRETIRQYNNNMAQTVANLPGEWLLADFPPHGMVDANDRFKGEVVSLVIDKEQTEIFRNYLPFREDLGWYPYVRVTGFFNQPGHGQAAPSLSVILTEFRRPKLYQDAARDYFSFLEGEFKNVIYLKNRSNLQLAGYVLPFLAEGSNIKKVSLVSEQKSIAGCGKNRSEPAISGSV